MGCIASRYAVLISLVIIKRRNDLERIKSSLESISGIYDLALKVSGKLHILVLGVEYEDFCILGRKVCKQALGSIRLT